MIKSTRVFSTFLPNLLSKIITKLNFTRPSMDNIRHTRIDFTSKGILSLYPRVCKHASVVDLFCRFLGSAMAIILNYQFLIIRDFYLMAK